MSLTTDLISQVWAKGATAANNSPAIWRKDQCGAWINFNQHGNRNSDYGWEIDHISPGDNDNISNLRPLHWANNVRKSDGRLSCPVVAQDNINVRRPE